MSELFFTADEHYDHVNILEYCSRPFSNVYEMNETLINNHNNIVKSNDLVYHLGDFTLAKDAKDFQHRLRGNHIYLKGSHDYWIQADAPQILGIKVAEQHIILCHYAMRVWASSHYGSWQLYGHSHGKLLPRGKQWDVGVDNNQFRPISFDEVVTIMQNLPENENRLKL
jgi:calcineurin-like phosphoesterase family protein